MKIYKITEAAELATELREQQAYDVTDHGVLANNEDTSS